MCLSGPDEKSSFECEPRSGERFIAWGVSPRTKVKRKIKPRSGDRNLELTAVAHIAVISIRLDSLVQERSVAPSGGFLSDFRPYPGAHAPGYEYAAPPALKLGRHSGACSLWYLLGCQPRPGRDSILYLASHIRRSFAQSVTIPLSCLGNLDCHAIASTTESIPIGPDARSRARVLHRCDRP